MSNRYTYQFNGSFKPRMSQIEGRVMVGSGGQVDAATASGTTFGAYGVPSGWIGAYSGCLGLLKAGIASVARTTTGTYLLGLEDGWTKPLQSAQVTYYSGATASAGATGILIGYVAGSNLGINSGNPQAPQPTTIIICFANSVTGLLMDPPSGAGFMVDIRLDDSSAGPQ